MPNIALPVPILLLSLSSNLGRHDQADQASEVEDPRRSFTDEMWSMIQCTAPMGDLVRFQASPVTHTHTHTHMFAI